MLFFFCSIRIPFNWKTPLGYLIACSFEMILTLYVCHLIACYLILVFGCCFIMIKFADELKEEFSSLVNSNKSTGNLEVIIEEPEQESSEDVEKDSKNDPNELLKEEVKEDSEEGRKEESGGKRFEKEPEQNIDGKPNKIAAETTERFKRFVEFHTEVIELS